MPGQSISEALLLAPHPLRARVLAELHARPFVAMTVPKRVLHFAFMTRAGAAAKDHAALAAFCHERAVPEPAPDATHHRVDLSPAVLRWERHGEFTTYTWEFPSVSAPDAAERSGAFRPSAGELAGVMRLVPQPGPLLVATDLHLLPEDAVGDAYQRVFGARQLAASEVVAGAARIVTDFHPDAFGFVRILVLDRRLTAGQAGALVQRLLEIDTYRTLALLGLPEAQEVAPTLRQIETELPMLMRQMRESDSLEANRHLLDRLTVLAGELEAGAAQSLYRFGATRAYHEVMRLRLEAIGEQPVPGLPSFAAFLSRRLAPAVRTCAATETRQDNLSRKLTNAAQLLRTRVEVALESQNSDLLRTMNDRVRLQLRLQQTVEGLSIAAITYYVASILHLVFEGLHARFARLDPPVATAIAVPFILLFVALMLRRIRRGHADG